VSRDLVAEKVRLRRLRPVGDVHGPLPLVDLDHRGRYALKPAARPHHADEVKIILIASGRAMPDSSLASAVISPPVRERRGGRGRQAPGRARADLTLSSILTGYLASPPGGAHLCDAVLTMAEPRPRVRGVHVVDELDHRLAGPRWCLSCPTQLGSSARLIDIVGNNLAPRRRFGE